ncbi:hypothetical protein ABZ686_08575 [Streptomyces sp. NPDC006992]|uniref:NACHT domain-containing protein n=1 Tax=Streptomyces sp. NPDC006992 TaxID=3155601 RepID=UPI0033D1DC6E
MGPVRRDGANRDLKDRLKAVLTREGLSQADIVRQTQLSGESVSKAAVSNALNPEKGPPVAFTLGAILNAAGISGTEREELFRLRDRAEPHGTTQLEAYLEAAEKATRQHPYTGVLGALSLPTLADVYVHQQARTPGNRIGRVRPAAEIFVSDQDICVLLGGPGGGKSTLLRAHLADAANDRLGDRARKTIPVMVRAAALTGNERLPTDLAKSTNGDLGPFGLLDELSADFFRRAPRAGKSWLVLVDGLDEIPDADARSAVLTKVAGAAGNGPYRFVVATRPLPATELDTLGQLVPHYELKPFSDDDLLVFAARWFRPLDAPVRHARAFLAGLRRSCMDGLARTPLMALILCQLYAADPAHPLPEGRSGAYQSFVELMYEQNAHKNIKNTHDEAIRRLKDRHQIPRDNQAAEQAALQVRDHLPDLIDQLADAKINGSDAPAIEVLASHLQVTRPRKVNQHLWNSFLGDLLRATGVLTQRADDFDFLHQTLLEYHAARHATRDEKARTRLLHRLFASRRQANGRLRPPPETWDDSYRGFLLDGLLSPQDHIATETAQYLEELTAHGGKGACRFLTAQVDLRTTLPPRSTLAQLARFVDDTTLWDIDRVTAAGALAQVDRTSGIARLLECAANTTFDGEDRVLAASCLAQIDKEAGASLLIRLAQDITLDGHDHMRAAEALSWLDGEAAAPLLTRFASDTDLSGGIRVWAAEALAHVDAETSAPLLTSLALDTTLRAEFTHEGDVRMRAAQALAQIDWKAGAALLIGLARDTTRTDISHLRAAEALAQLDREAGAALLTRFAGDRALSGDLRVRAAEALAQVDREAGAALLTRLAHDTTRHDYGRVRTAEALAQVDRKAGAALLANLARDTTHWHVRGRAFAALANEAGEDGAALLARLAADATLDDDSRVDAAEALIEAGRKAGAALLAHFTCDTTLNDDVCRQAAKKLAQVCRAWPAARRHLSLCAGNAVRRCEDREVDLLLARLTPDAPLEFARVWAAEVLARVDREAGVALLAHFADDSAISGDLRVQAAEALTRMDHAR